MIALAAALLLAQGPAPREARPAPPPAGERAGEPAEQRPDRARSPDAETPDRAGAVDPSDEEVIRNLELLEKLDLLLRLELFDPAGEPPAKQKGKKEEAKPPPRSGDAPKR